MKLAASRTAALLLVLTGAMLAASCDETTAPELLESWALESWFGEEPPLLIYHTEDPDAPGVACAHVLVSSEIELRTEGRLDMIDALTETCGDGDARPYTDARHGSWMMEGDSLFLDIVTDDPILPTAPLNGRVVDGRLRFEFQVYSEAESIDTVAIVYRRVL